MQMADKTKNVILDIKAKDQATATLQKVSKNLKEIENSSNSLSNSSNNLSSSISSFATKIGVAGAAVLVAKQGYEQLKKLIVESKQAWKEQEEANTRLAAALGYTSTSLQDYASALQDTTNYSDDVVQASMAQIAAFIQDEEQIKKVQKAAIDLAAAKKMDLTSATDLLTKSIVSGSNAMGRYGISMVDSEDMAKRLESAVSSVNNAFEGTAEALAKTDFGKLDQMNLKLSDAKEVLGKEMLPLMRQWEELNNKIETSLVKLTTKFVMMANSLVDAGLGTTGKTSVIINQIESLASPIDQLEATEKALEETQKLIDKNNIAWEEYYGLQKLGDKGGAQKALQRATAAQKENDLLNERIKLLKAIEQTAFGKATAQTTTIMPSDPEGLLEEQRKKEKEALEKSAKDWEDLSKAIESTNKSTLDKRKKAIEDQFDWEYELALQKDNDIQQARQSFYDELNSLEISGLETSFSGRYELIERGYNDEMTLKKHLLDQNIITKQEYDQYEIELEAQKLDQITQLHYEQANTITGIAAEVGGLLQQTSNAIFQYQNEKLDEETDKKRKAAKDTIKNKKVLDKELERIDNDAEKKRKEIAKREKQIALIMSIINTAQGVTKALSSSAPPLNFVMAALTGVAGAIQIGLIASQAFAQGGFVQQAQGASKTGDNTLIRANPGEMVLNQTQKDNMLWNLATKRQAVAQQPVLGGDTYIVQGNLDSTAVKELRKYKEDALQLFRDYNKELSRRGYQYAY